ncbi:MAG TPA: 30S ribosomal protein S4 [Candidatus Babeliales bacterium]|nr:30S ribosomal protein S4 [Candidatus Babeliales bacterium]
MEKLKKDQEKGQQDNKAGAGKKRGKKLSGYGIQLKEKQKVKEIYGMRERQFKRFFDLATKSEGGAGENLLSLLERRLDNVVYRLKLAVTRTQARQIIVHGHVLVNGKKVSSPSFLIGVNDKISLADKVAKKDKFLEQVIDKRLSIGIKVPEWLELNKQNRDGLVLRFPVRSDIQAPIEEHLIVELYSK